jgi:hypothetical protein
MVGVEQAEINAHIVANIELKRLANAAEMICADIDNRLNGIKANRAEQGYANRFMRDREMKLSPVSYPPYIYDPPGTNFMDIEQEALDQSGLIDLHPHAVRGAKTMYIRSLPAQWPTGA